MNNKYLLLALAGLMVGTNVWADETGGFDVGVKVSTLGTGVEVNYPLSSFMTVAVGINKFSKSRTDNVSGNDYDEDINLQTMSVLFNFHPFAGSFRLTAGAMLNNNELKLATKPGGTYVFNGNTYTTADIGNLDATVDFRRIAPYAGLGLGHSASRGLGFTLDVGVLMQGEPNVDLKSTGGILSGDPTFQADLAQAEADAENDIKDFTLYPVIALGISYRF